jgi:hypothetical protein
MKKTIIALSLLAFISSCKKKEFTCYCTDGNEQLVYKKTLDGLNYAEFQTYCDAAAVQNHQNANGVTCEVLNEDPEETTE